MKAIMIVYNHGITEEVEDALQQLAIRGFTKFLNVHGQGSQNGEPHLGTHVWPSQNAVVLTVIPEEMVDPLMEKIKEINAEAEEQGIHAFVWNIEQMI